MRIQPDEFKKKIESYLRSNTPGATATKVLLCVLALGGAVVLAGVAPGLSLLMKKHKKKFSGKQLENSYQYTRKRGFIKIKQQKNGTTKVFLTHKGIQRVKECSIDTVKITKQKKWDGYFRVVMYDIPTRYNRARTALRLKLENLGFFKLQESVWIYPYSCTNEIIFIAEVFKVLQFIEITETKDLLINESKILKYFKLTK